MAIDIGIRSIKKIIAEKKKVIKVYAGDMMVYDKSVDPNLLLPLTFIAEKAGSTVALNKNANPPWEGEYSLDNENWLPYVPSTTGNITLVNVGDKVYFRGNIRANFGISDNLRFAMTGTIRAEGNINSMYVAVDFEELKTLTYTYCYCTMFESCRVLTAAPLLPATTLSSGCYWNMFYRCSALTTAPELPATTLANSCYISMFNECSKLTAVPELPARTLTQNCYSNMFNKCTSLTAVPELPATTLANYCYQNMFNGCTLVKVSLTKEGIYQNTWQFGATPSGNQATNMFASTGGTFTGTPDVAVLYTSNALV